MATATKRTQMDCPYGWTRTVNGNCVKTGYITTSLPAIAAAYAMANDPVQFRALLVKKGIVANATVASKLTPKQLVSTVVSYYNTNGNAAGADLLSQFVPNPNTKNVTTNKAVVTQATADLGKVVPGLVTTSGNSGDLLDLSWLQTGWNALVGSTTTTQNPVVTTTSSPSAITAAYIIGGVALVGILAYVVIKM